MRWVAERKPNLLVHLDLHETTDSDLHEFDPARCARDGKPFERDTIPDGFYVIGNSEDPQGEFQKALIAAVAPWGAGLVLGALALAGLVVLTRVPVRVVAETTATTVRPAGSAAR